MSWLWGCELFVSVFVCFFVFFVCFFNISISCFSLQIWPKMGECAIRYLILNNITTTLFHYSQVHRGYYMAAWRYEISLRVLKNISFIRCAHSWNIDIIDTAKNMKKVYTIPERLVSLTKQVATVIIIVVFMRAFFHSERTKSSWPYACCKNVHVK